MKKPVTEIKDYLKLCIKVWGHGQGQEKLVLDHGKSYRITPRTFEGKRATPKQCYKNAFMLALDNDDLTYVEGFVHIGIMPIGHAWCVDKKGNVIDPTLRKTGTCDAIGYFGIPFKKDYVRKVALETKVYGIISYTNPSLFNGEVKPEEFKK